ncbi:MAG: DNA recombination protein RmuC [Alphaproteobacteria bacterium]|nr:DNA recombination protein RmuC [Alphaproteobacteria bacterium]MDA7988488.1 DNA recombination protein RmuC [Alphaproteobacteria bacterium]
MTNVLLILVLVAVAALLALTAMALRAAGKSEETLRFEGKMDASLEQIRAQMESVHKGLGEMQVLADDVERLGRTLGGVKTRGIWGEVQLRSILDDIVPGRYDEQVSIKEGSDRGGVDFAVRLPRKQSDGKEILLPIDAKFPLTHYERVVEAGNANDKKALKEAQKALVKQVKNLARSIKEEYVAPPRTTDFALMYVPTEGIFSELLRMPGLMNELRREYRVALSGPVSIGAILETIKSGYQTMAMEENAQRVRDTLISVRREFDKFGEGLESVNKSLQAANNKMEQMETRQRQMRRALESVGDMEDEK